MYSVTTLMTAFSPDFVTTFGAESRSVSLRCDSMCRIIERSASPRNALTRMNWSLFDAESPEMWLPTVER